MGSLEVSPAADVLVYEVVDESARTRAQLHYFLVDGTAAVFGGGGRAPTAFRLGAGPGGLTSGYSHAVLNGRHQQP